MSEGLADVEEGLRWTRRAARDLVEIGAFLGAHDRIAARRWIERLRERAEIAADIPKAGRVVPELARDDVREVFLKSYRIAYRVLAGEVAVLTIFEGHRQLPPNVDE